jgi:hypothetical protein
MSRVKWPVIVAIGLCLPGCSLGIVAGADFAPSTDFARYSVYSWDEADDRPVGDPRLENNPFFEQRLHAAIAVELAEHGIVSEGLGAGLVVHHHVTVRNRVDVYEADENRGYTRGMPTDRAQIIQFDEGTILVDIADAETKDVIWRGWAVFDISRALANPDLMERAIEEAIRKMFGDFPEQAPHP